MLTEVISVRVECLTKKHTGKKLLDLGFKLNNLPTHMRSSDEDHLNKYVKVIKAPEHTIRSVVGAAKQEAVDVLGDEYGWFVGFESGIHIGSTAMGYVTDNHFGGASIFLWKKVGKQRD